MQTGPPILASHSRPRFATAYHESADDLLMVEVVAAFDALANQMYFES